MKRRAALPWVKRVAFVSLFPAITTDGNKLTKIIISNKKNQNKKIDSNNVTKIAKEIKNIELLIEYID